MSSISLGLVEDYHGKSVAIVGLKAYAKIFSAFDPAILQKNISGIVMANLSEIASAAFAKAPFRTGFLRSTIGYEMIGPMAGTAFVSAPYALKIEKGFTTPTGGQVSAQPYFTPAAATGIRQFIADMRLYLSTLTKGGAFSLRPIKTIPTASVKALPRKGQGRGVHKYTRKIAIGGGKFRYQYGRDIGTVSRRTALLKPGLGKSIRQSGRRRRVV